jgi:coenzyme F420-0:L-glutamate ligase/coenzyme F420-1:gamma-L-glutamate ligase
MHPALTIFGISGLPELNDGEDLGGLLARAAAAQGTPLAEGDVVVVAQKAVSKAEGRVTDLRTVTPSALASDFAARWGKDPRAVEVALAEAARVVRMEAGILITETRHGFVCANSGVDASNVGRGPADGGAETVVLLPLDPDASARAIRDRVREEAGVRVGVIVSDTFGRPWREGALNLAIGAAGIAVAADYRGQTDADGRLMQTSVIAVGDELAAASELVTGKRERVPAAVVRGYPFTPSEEGIAPLMRDRARDLFR